MLLLPYFPLPAPPISSSLELWAFSLQSQLLPSPLLSPGFPSRQPQSGLQDLMSSLDICCPTPAFPSYVPGSLPGSLDITQCHHTQNWSSCPKSQLLCSEERHVSPGTDLKSSPFAFSHHPLDATSYQILPTPPPKCFSHSSFQYLITPPPPPQGNPIMNAHLMLPFSSALSLPSLPAVTCNTQPGAHRHLQVQLWHLHATLLTPWWHNTA